MRTTLRFLLLGFPLIWYLSIWVTVVFGISFGGKPVFNSVIFDYIWLAWAFIGTPLSLIIGLIYTYRKKLWYWFFAYLLFGGGLFVSAYIARFF